MCGVSCRFVAFHGAFCRFGGVLVDICVFSPRKQDISLARKKPGFLAYAYEYSTNIRNQAFASWLRFVCMYIASWSPSSDQGPVGVPCSTSVCD